MINFENKQSAFRELELATGETISDCYQCGKCTAGCPAATTRSGTLGPLNKRHIPKINAPPTRIKANISKDKTKRFIQ
ncbi:hypothetical protein THIOM_002834 [Candidatus Thiomargarita nelsonii]|uniref:4Fe-4S ferredoxin-type domain-containing protein n=1 Tax=Candidatus Thiomargarita nelsonii TaxID=1003181 RepID=A0A176S0F9_9GAMM|nr:hypothetical protein THIOM_002834 [Candidatus Thiomargarita nelsonii]